MKKIIIILTVALFAFGTIYAEGFNEGKIGEPSTVSTKIITPLTITVDQSGPRDFGNMIQGETRTFENPTPIALFNINRETDQSIWLTVYEPTVNDGLSGVTLNTKVYRYTGNWTGGGAVEFAPNTPLQWDADGGSICNVAIVVSTASASETAAIGTHEFKVHIWAQYKAF